MTAADELRTLAGFMVVHYHGVTRSGQHHFAYRGIYTDEIVPFVADKFAARWRSLEVYNRDRELIGWIAKGEDGKRTWWADAGQADDATRLAAKSKEVADGCRS